MYKELAEGRGKLQRETKMAEESYDRCRATNRRRLLRWKITVEGRNDWHRATNRSRGRRSWEESIAVYLLGSLLLLAVPASSGTFFLSRTHSASIWWTKLIWSRIVCYASSAWASVWFWPVCIAFNHSVSVNWIHHTLFVLVNILEEKNVMLIQDVQLSNL